MQFLYQPLTWGFLLVGVPILIHLINMLRHRKVRWAAMDFLLESHRRNRRWVMLKQWLLLASRMLAMFLLVMLLAKWLSGSQWLSWFGGQTTHHYVLVDDSYSMGAKEGNATAYSRALNAVSGLVKSISQRPGQHQITLVRWSRASLIMGAEGEEARLDAAADLLGQSISQNYENLLERVNATEPSSLSLTPEETLELVLPLVAENADQKSEIYVVSDLRRNEFAEPDALRNQLKGLGDSDAKIHIVDCVEEESENLSLVSMEPEKGVWSAGVPMMVRYQVRNRNTQAASNVVVRLKTVTYARDATQQQIDQEYSGAVLELPIDLIEQIAPGETVTRQTEVLF
ncbi:MAG: BatA domain-containing protein, partial [Planctomycetota bacterium]